MDTHQIGKDAEEQAKRYLIAQGLTLIQQNYHSRFGEIDLVMQHKDLILFIEVKKRSRRGFGGALASVTPKKQQKLIATAEIFLAEHPMYQDCNCRFDVITFDGKQANQSPMWYKDAFRLDTLTT